MTDGKDTAAKTKPLISKEKTPKSPRNHTAGSGFWAFLRFGSKIGNRQRKGGARYAPYAENTSRENGRSFLDERGRKKI